MQGKRLDRVNQLVKEEISTLLQRELKDPRLGFVSVTEVETARDFEEMFHAVVIGTRFFLAAEIRREPDA